MLKEEIVKKLREQGHELGDWTVNSVGKICWLVDGVTMFQEDAADVARGSSTVAEVILRKSPISAQNPAAPKLPMDSPGMKAAKELQCAVCGRSFRPVSSRSKYCCLGCQEKAAKRLTDESHRRNREKRGGAPNERVENQ